MRTPMTPHMPGTSGVPRNPPNSTNRVATWSPSSHPRDLALLRLASSSARIYHSSLSHYSKWLTSRQRGHTLRHLERFMSEVAAGRARGPRRAMGVMLSALQYAHDLDPLLPAPTRVHTRMAQGMTSVAPPLPIRPTVPVRWMLSSMPQAHTCPATAILWICLGASLRGREWMTLADIRPQGQDAVVIFSCTRKRHHSVAPLRVSRFLVKCWKCWCLHRKPAPSALHLWGTKSLHIARSSWATLAYRMCIPTSLIFHHLQHRGPASLHHYIKAIPDAEVAMLLGNTALQISLFNAAELAAACVR
jgi:hypothetical protein